jgi:hypothetical protein
MRVFTESDVQAGIGTTNNYPFAGPNAVEAVSWAAHPLYETAPFFVHDVGVVILQAPGVVLPEYGTLPDVDEFDAFKTKRGLQKVSFTSVGYGLQQSFPDPASFLAHNVKTRFVAYPRLIQINVPGFTGDFSMLLSNNANTAAPALATRVVPISWRTPLSLPALRHLASMATAPELVACSAPTGRMCSISSIRT